MKDSKLANRRNRRERNLDRTITRREAGERPRYSPLNSAEITGLLSPGQVAAANKYRLHWHFGGVADTAPDAAQLFAPQAIRAGENFHRSRYYNAIELIGRTRSEILDRALCRELPFSDRRQMIPAAMRETRAALDMLCAEWGIY